MLPAPADSGYGRDREKRDIFLVLDNSGSMKKNDPEFLTHGVATNFLKNIGKESRLGMVIFDEAAVLAEPLSELSKPGAGERFLKSLEKINYKGRWSDSPAGIERAIYELKTNGRKDAQKVIIFLTDGIVETGNKNNNIEKLKWLKEDLADDCKKSGIRIFAAAFTEKADFSLIQILAHKTGGRYFRAYKAEEIAGVFAKIHEAIEKTAAGNTEKVQPTPASPPISAKEILIPLPVILGGGIAVLVILILLFLAVKNRKTGKNKQPGKPFPGDEKELPMPAAELIDERGIISRQSIKIGKKNVKIGRDPDNDVIIPKRTVSAFHATIKYENNCFYLEDQRSSNSTRLNDKKINPNTPMRLKSGDLITFDAYRFRFILPFQAFAGETILHRVDDQPEASRTIIRKLEDLEKEKKKPVPGTIAEPSEPPGPPGPPGEL